MKNFKQSGHVLTVAAPYDVQQGTGVLVGNIFGIANAVAKSGAALELLCQGVFYKSCHFS